MADVGLVAAVASAVVLPIVIGVALRLVSRAI